MQVGQIYHLFLEEYSKIYVYQLSLQLTDDNIIYLLTPVAHFSYHPRTLALLFKTLNI